MSQLELLDTDHIPRGYLFASENIPTREIYPTGKPPHHSGMDINEIRLKNLREIAQKEGSVAALARKMDMSYALLQNYIGKTPIKRIGDKTARKAEEACLLPRGWLDKLQTDEGNVVEAKPAYWPFQIERSRFDALPKLEKDRIGRFIRDTVETWEATQDSEIRKAG